MREESKRQDKSLVFQSQLQSALGSGYTIDRELTGGGMSRVFVATDVALGRKVVVKVLPPELAAGVNHDRFRREIQVAAQLQHPHVVPLLSAGEDNVLIWYTMPFINGHSLREALAKGTKYSMRDIVRIIHDVADALSYAHGLGVIHRDIKPGNVLLLGSHALVTDFGVSKAISASMPASGFTSAGMAIGTPAYMAPEQIAADPDADHRMDLYALGLLAYEMLTGAAPFKEKSPQQTMAAQLTRDPRPIEELREDVPPALSALVRRLLAKLPSDRPQSAAEVVTILDDITLSSGPHPAERVKKPRPVRTILAGLAALLIVSLVWRLGERSGEESIAALVRDSLVSAESHQFVASPAAFLTREDSMAIARAVASRTTEAPQSASETTPSVPGVRRPGADSLRFVAFVDSVRALVQRDFLDSLVQETASRLILERTQVVALAPGALSVDAATELASPRGGGGPTVSSARQRRVVIALPREIPDRADLRAIGSTLADSLRTRLGDHPRYSVVPADSVAAVLADSRTVNTVQERLDADIVVSIWLRPQNDSVQRVIHIRDLTGPIVPNFRSVMTVIPATSPAAGINTMMQQTFRALLDMQRGIPPTPAAERGAATEGPGPRL